MIKLDIGIVGLFRYGKKSCPEWMITDLRWEVITAAPLSGDQVMRDHPHENPDSPFYDLKDMTACLTCVPEGNADDPGRQTGGCRHRTAGSSS